MARPKKEINAKGVEQLAGYGCTNAEIAAFYDCTESTIRKRFSDIVTKGRELGKTRLRKKQITVALQGNVSMLIWLGKNMLDQKDQIAEKIDQDIKVTIEYVEGKSK